MKEITPDTTLNDLRKLFEVQFQEFVRQFLDSSVDLDSFFENIDDFDSKLDGILEDYLTETTPKINQSLDASVAIFMRAFIDKTYEETEPEETEEK